jgi:GMP synthase (glutamine-hydrolysing)
MKKNPQQLKILLMQIREDEATRQEEFYQFAQCSGLAPQQFTQLNVFATPHFNPEYAAEFDALFIGGSSDASVLQPERYPFDVDCKRMLRYCYIQDIPVFASCFGFQLAVEEFGGKVILDKANMEMGILTFAKMPAAATDKLMHDIPDNFASVVGHKERAEVLPPNAEWLARSELCPYHAFKFPDKPFYAFQFHPEMSRQDLISRLERYQARYLAHEDEMQAIFARAQQSTTYANALIKQFVERII